MFKDSLRSHALLGLLDQQLLDEILCVFGQSRWEVNVTGTYVHYLFHGLLSAYVVEGSFADQQLVSQDSQTPHIHTHVVLASLQNLRSSVIKSATVGSSSLVADGCPPKIAQLTHTVSEDYIFWFDISVSDALVMQIPDSLSNFSDCVSSLYLFQFLLFFKITEQSPFFHVFQQQVQILTVIKNSIQFGYVPMVAKTLYSNLDCQLLDHHMGFDRCFAYFFKSICKSTLFVDYFQHCAEFTLSQSFGYDEIRQFGLFASLLLCHQCLK